MVLGIIVAGMFRSGAKEKNAGKKEDANPKVEFSAEAEAKFSEFLTKASEAKRKQWVERMKKDIAEIAKVAKVDAEGVEKLGAIANEAAELCRAGWEKKIDQFWRRQYGRQPQEAFVQIIDQVMSQVDQYVQNDFFGDYVRPQEHPVWIEGLKRVLTAEQLAIWEKAQATRKEVLTKDIGDFLKPLVAQNREQFSRMRIARGAEIKQTLALSKERSDQVDALANAIADEAAETWRKHAERNLLLLEDTVRRNVMKNGQYFVGLDEEDLSRQETMWKEGVAKLLSAEDNQRLEKVREDRKDRRIRACALLIIAEFDQKIAFTTSQRERLRALVEKVVPSINTLFPNENNPYGNEITLFTIFTNGAKIKEEDIKEILDPLQLQHWHEVSAQPESDLRSRRVLVRKNRRTAVENEPPANLEPEDVENLISDFLRDKTAGERKRGLLSMIVKAEDAARIAMVNPESVERLQTAARGAAEQSFAVWRVNLETNIRGNLNDADAENLKTRLASIPEYQLGGGYNSDAEATILDEALKMELSDGQQAAWKKELDARKEYRAKAISAYILTQFDRRHLLTAEQFEKLAPKIEVVLREYDREFAQMFSYAGGWHLQYFSQLMPFAGIPEKELKEILSKEQWESWSGSNECSNANNYWENIKRNHEQRMKEAKK
jgi:hypothetical protein